MPGSRQEAQPFLSEEEFQLLFKNQVWHGQIERFGAGDALPAFPACDLPQNDRFLRDWPSCKR